MKFAILKLTGWLLAVASISILCLPAFAEGPASPPAIAGPQPHIQVAAPNYDFGTVMEGDPVKHDFTVKNVGKADLVIGHVQTSCGCTVAQSEKKRLAPGEETQLPVTFDTRHERGHASRRIDVYTNDPQTPDLALEIQGIVRREAEATPAEVFFDAVRKGTEQSRDVVISYNGKAKDFKITKVSNSNSNIAVTQAPGLKLKVALLKTMPAGPFQDTVEVATTGRPIEISVYGRVVGNLVTEPAQVSFGILPHGSGAMRIVRLTNNGARPVTIKEVSSTSPVVMAKAEPITAGKQYKITLELLKGSPDGQLRGQLVIKTDDPGQASLTVPFYGIVGSFKG
ncbi:MAG TPA: DUF1573 domain-containing protein [Candidatus Binataceae bacterium]|nr:DUF1573 domain-containing protein [Candidatus Binataceae bacterium]